MKLLSIELNNFQAHEKTVVVFSPTITTIKGPTDVGKSAILRALRWVCLNDIAGDEFIKEGEKKTIVALELNVDGGGKEIVRVRSAGGAINTYELDDEEYKAFGQGVPSDVVKLLKLNEINFQGQHDSPFWFNETAGEVSRRLNAVVDLTVIDSALSSIASEVGTARSRVALTTERLTEAKNDYENLKPQEARIEQFTFLKEHHDRLDKIKENHNRLETLVERARHGRDQVKELEERTADGEGVLTAAKEALDCSRQVNTLDRILTDILIQEGKAQPPPNFKPIEGLFDDWQVCDEKAKELSRLVESATRASATVDNTVKALETAEKRFHQETKGKKCPLCEQIIEA